MNGGRVPEDAAPIEALTELVREAGRETLRWYPPDEVVRKADGSPLTRADRAAHRILSEGLARILPGVPVLSEESAPEDIRGHLGWRRFWLVDPLDGTREFLRGTGEFTVNVALVKDGCPVVGVVDVPALDRCYRASASRGAEVSRDGTPFRSISTRVPAAAPPVVVASRDHLGPGARAFAEALGDGVRFTSMGSSLKFCLVAEGAADYYPRDLPTMEWDTAAADCILRAAGGRVVAVGGDGMPAELAYNRPTLRNPPFLAVGDPEGPWLGPLAAAAARGWSAEES